MNDTKFNQRKRILQYCEEHGSITIREAFEKLFINSPSKRISEMRLSGYYDVDFVVEKRTNAAGKEVRYKRYYISEPVRGEAR